MVQHTIIGGGIIGLLTAYYLVEAGESVSILERGKVGQESSWAGGGIISPLYPWRYSDAVTNLVQWSQAHYPQLTKSLEVSTGLSVELINSGLLILDENEIEQAQHWAQCTQTQINLISAEQIKQIEPTLHYIPQQALWLPDVAQVRNPRLVKALKEYVRAKGAIIEENVEVLDLIYEYKQVVGLKTNLGERRTNTAVISCGAWTANLAAGLGKVLNVEPVKGQMLLIKTTPGLINTIVLYKDHYIIPRHDGRVLVGSTLEHVGFNKTTTKLAYNELMASALALFPRLGNYPVERHWAGLRPGSPNNVPTICEHPEIRGVYINAGHYRNGVVTAPASAQLLCNLILNEKPIIDQLPYII